MSKNNLELREKRGSLVKGSPLAFLMASGVIADMCRNNPLLETNGNGEFKKIKKIDEKNFFDMSVRYLAWMRGTSTGLGRYLEFEVANMWNAFNNGRLTQEYQPDPLLGTKGLLERTVDGFGYRIAQMTPTVEIGGGWRIADWNVVPTGRTDLSRVEFPDLVRGSSPLIFYHPDLSENEWELRRDLTDNYARGLFVLRENTQTGYIRARGYQVSVWDGSGDGPALRRKDIFSIMREGYGPDHLEQGWEGANYGTRVRTNGELVCQMLNSARSKLIPLVDKVALSAKKIGDGFWTDFVKEYRKYGEATVESFSQVIMSGWPGTMGVYFEQHYNKPVADFMRRR